MAKPVTSTSFSFFSFGRRSSQIFHRLSSSWMILATCFTSCFATGRWSVKPLTGLTRCFSSRFTIAPMSQSFTCIQPALACLKLTSKCNTLHYIATLHSITQHNTLCQQYNVKNRWKLKYIVPATPNETMWYYNIVLCPLSIIILCWDVTNITLAP